MDNAPLRLPDTISSLSKHPLPDLPRHYGKPNATLCEILDTMPHMVWWKGADTGYCNLAWRDYAGSTFHPDWLQLVHPNERLTAQRRWQHCLENEQTFEAELRMRQHSGEYRWVLALSHPQPPKNDRLGILLSCTDIHERVLGQAALAHSAQLQTSMLDVSVDCIKMLRTDGTIQHMNRSGCIALGVPEDETGFGMKWLDLLPPEVRQRGLRALQSARSGKNARFAGMSVAGGQTQHWDNILTPNKGDDGSIQGILCVSRDVTLQREAERLLRISSERDELTGLLNRRAFNVQINRTLRQTRDGLRSVGLMLIDLDHFKHVNDTLGHPAGDHLLRVLAKRLESAMEREGFVARLGGDEFAIVAHHVHDEEHFAHITQRVLQQIDAPITYSGKIINGGMSIGCAIYPRDAQDAHTLMKKADTALNNLKAGGRGGVRMFTPEMLAAAESTALQLEQARKIVRESNVLAYYQPKVDLYTGTITGFEALLRWVCPENGLQPPNSVEEAFKDYELATKISALMQAQVFADIASWLQQGLPVVPVSLNAAPVEFLRDDYAENLLERLAQHGIPNALIELEITEHMLAERGSELVIRAAHVLKQAGIRIALDDFGTGHSSLAHLRDYPVHALKIDCNFVHRMIEDPSIAAIVQAISQLGPKLGMHVIAEGVESEAHRAMLLNVGCTTGQGYLFSPAVHRQDAQSLLQRNGSRRAA